MAIEDVKIFLEHENKEFLEGAWELAQSLSKKHPPETFESQMYAAWMDYFDELAGQNCTMLAWSGEQIRQTLNEEVKALEILEGKLDKVLAGKLNINAVPLVQTLRDVIKVEREAADEMQNNI